MACDRDSPAGARNYTNYELIDRLSARILSVGVLELSCRVTGTRRTLPRSAGRARPAGWTMTTLVAGWWPTSHG